MKNFYLSLLLFFVFDLSLAADQGFSKSEGVKLKFHKENYFYLYSKMSSNAPDTYQTEETQFQLSFKLSPIRFKAGELSLAYTQKAFWQLYDSENSRSFRETNYNPEIFLRLGTKSLFVDLGYEHESNGKKDPESRSWDRAYLKTSFISRNFKISLKSWTIIDEDDYGEDQVERKQSMRHFYGYHSLEAGFLTGTTILKLKGRHNFKTSKSFGEAKLLFLIKNGLYWAFGYAKGYGTSLQTYDVDLETYSFGLLMHP